MPAPEAAAAVEGGGEGEEGEESKEAVRREARSGTSLSTRRGTPKMEEAEEGPSPPNSSLDSNRADKMTWMSKMDCGGEMRRRGNERGCRAQGERRRTEEKTRRKRGHKRQEQVREEEKRMRERNRADSECVREGSCENSSTHTHT